MNSFSYALKIIRLIKLNWWQFSQKMYFRFLGVKVGLGVRFYGKAIVSVFEGSYIEIADKCVICSDSSMTALGVNHPVVIRTLRKGAMISVGHDTGISGASICAALNVTIGNNCLIGANVVIVDTDFHSIHALDRRYNQRWQDIGCSPTVIGNNIFIGTGAIILKGVTIEDGSVIGAGAVVTKNVPSNSIVAGNPAIVIGCL
jgi:acetyltransferase-like isoleucine patch superfamily enzyme